ncbi:MAG: SGNH/GDSL hydrolase family protein, partial [Firmicutes bacterium]|nr:SGNH/GDSL hydrolase family protein [Candidatus Scybalomonas excrementavium]
MKDTLYKQIKDGIYTREEVTPDGLHPNDKGHEFVANELITFLERVKEGNVTDPLIPLSPMKEPFTANQYEGAKRLTIRNSFPTLHGFRVDTKEKKGHLDCFKNGWIGKKEGDSIQFELEASCLAIQYRKTIQKPAPIARVIVDGKVEEAILLDSNFQEDWGDCLFLEPILHHGEKKKHEITIEIIEATKEDQAPFYLLSLIFV